MQDTKRRIPAGNYVESESGIAACWSMCGLTDRFIQTVQHVEMRDFVPSVMETPLPVWFPPGATDQLRSIASKIPPSTSPTWKYIARTSPSRGPRRHDSRRKGAYGQSQIGRSEEDKGSEKERGSRRKKKSQRRRKKEGKSGTPIDFGDDGGIMIFA
jgi:hypothetical protein